MATISVGGIGSGLDVNSILEQIVAAERSPTENRLNLAEATLQAELSAFGTLKGSISTFQLSLDRLKQESSFSTNEVSVNNTDVLVASVSSIAEPGNYSVEVKELAQSHALASIAFDELDEVVGTGTLTFNFGTTDYDPGTDFQTGDDTYNGFTQNPDRSSETITIDSTNNTVSGLRDAINNADIGVTASIVDDGTGYRLLLSAEDTGLDNSMQIVVDEGGAPADNIDTSGLSVLAFNASATNIEQTQAARDADITVNGLSVKRDSNTISGAIPGITLNLQSADVGNPVQVKVTNTSTSEAKSNITNFVDAFNEMMTVVNSLTEYGGDSGQNGILLGDTTTRNIMQQIRREVGGLVDNGGTFNSLGAIGITTNKDGSLSVDDETLSSALEQDYNSVAQLFYANGTTSDSEVLFSGSSASTQEGRYGISVGALATQGQLVGESVTGPVTIDGSNDSFSLILNGSSTGSLLLTQKTYNDMGELAQEIQNRLNATGAGLGASVEYVNGAFQVRTPEYGSGNTVKVSIENASLGFTSNAVNTEGTDVVGSIGTLPAVGEGRFLTGTGEASGLKLEITGDSAGSRGFVTFSKGIASKLDSLLAEFLSDTGQLSAKTESIDEQIEDIGEERVRLEVRVAELEERYRRQFTALDVLMGQLQATSNFLTQQLEGLPQIGGSK